MISLHVICGLANLIQNPGYAYVGLPYVLFLEDMSSGPAARGAFRGRAPSQMTTCPPANENCAPQARTVPQRN